ncbi:hypothetical protein JCM21738_3571 [Mesobacillus boroniphilus JCM 21738]|uniref:Uncharacterized protein n=2 Tax=Mesobacillus boroniphilus TaxID=308892 RepID=W4RS08_9BACI|nr:hypothetical protein JCM21738_3571 [Mesobacillus boroniphilus JCM 21738]
MTSKPTEQTPAESTDQPADSAGGDTQKNTPADSKQQPADKTDPNKADTSKQKDGTLDFNRLTVNTVRIKEGMRGADGNESENIISQ